jgi:hypothetical protein
LHNAILQSALPVQNANVPLAEWGGFGFQWNILGIADRSTSRAGGIARCDSTTFHQTNLWVPKYCV